MNKSAFGIISLNLGSEADYINQIASRAALNGLDCFRFIPSKINPVTHQVNGLKYESEIQSWQECEFPLPELLYDRCFYGDDEHSKQCISIVAWLKSRSDITFLGYGLPNKLELYSALSNTLLAPYLPPSIEAINSGMVLERLKRQEKLILKPINGSQGYGIYYVKKNDRNFHVKTEKQKKIISRIFPNETKLVHWLDQLLESRKYLLQPYLELSNKDLEPFDVRLFLQKDENGNWSERGRGIRIGNTGGLLSNLSAGGRLVDYNHWIETLPAHDWGYISTEIDYIIQHLPHLLEKEFLPLFELGIDIGVAKNGSVWILDVNSKPGRKVILKLHEELKETLYQAPLLYGSYISGSGLKERKPYHAKTLSH